MSVRFSFPESWSSTSLAKKRCPALLRISLPLTPPSFLSRGSLSCGESKVGQPPLPAEGNGHMIRLAAALRSRRSGALVLVASARPKGGRYVSPTNRPLGVGHVDNLLISTPGWLSRSRYHQPKHYSLH